MYQSIVKVKTIKIDGISVSIYKDGRLEIIPGKPMSGEDLVTWRLKNKELLDGLKAPYKKVIAKKASKYRWSKYKKKVIPVK